MSATGRMLRRKLLNGTMDREDEKTGKFVRVRSVGERKSECAGQQEQTGNTLETN